MRHPETSVEMTSKREADETNCRGGVLPVGETSRSDRGGGVSAEECSSRNLSNTSYPNAKHINPSVGMVIDHPQNDGRFIYRKREIGENVPAMRTSNARPYTDAPKPFRSIPPKREADQSNCRGAPLPYKFTETFTVDRGMLPPRRFLP